MKLMKPINCALFSLASCLLLSSCSSEDLPFTGKNPAEKQTEEISSRINEKKWKPVINKMTDDFAFHYGKKTYEGKKKSVGGKPFRNSIKRKDFVSYSHTVTEVKKINDNKYTVDADATLEISYKENGRKEADWPIRFTWVKKGDKWKLASVKYLEKRKFLTTLPAKKITKKKKTPPARAYATQEAASSISIKSDIGSGNETQQKAKQSIRSTIDDLSKKNRRK